MKISWVILTIVLLIVATVMFVYSVYLIVIGYSTEYGIGFTIGTFIIPIILYYLSYLAWKKSRK